MQSFTKFLTETLADEVKREPRSQAAQDAKKLGLKYMGFGRYGDRKGKVTFIVHNNKLVPYKGREELYNMTSKSYLMKKDAERIDDPKKKQIAKKKAEIEQQKTDEVSTALNQRASIDQNILKRKDDDIERTHRQLSKFYHSQVFSDNEREAIRRYTLDLYNPINQYLYKGFEEGTTGTQAQEIQKTIADLDSAFDQTEIPFDYSSYTGLSERYKPENFKVGETYTFRGYVSTSLDHSRALEFARKQTDPKKKSGGGGKVKVMLQVDLRKGQKGIYLEGEHEDEVVSSFRGEKETLLPRGSSIKIVSGPHHMDMSVFDSYSDDTQVVLFHCEVVDE